MEFVLCNKREITAKLTKQQNFAVSEALFENFEITDQIYRS